MEADELQELDGQEGCPEQERPVPQQPPQQADAPHGQQQREVQLPGRGKGQQIAQADEDGGQQQHPPQRPRRQQQAPAQEAADDERHQRDAQRGDTRDSPRAELKGHVPLPQPDLRCAHRECKQQGEEQQARQYRKDGGPECRGA